MSDAISTDTTTWLDLVPAVPLVRGVPVIIDPETKHSHGTVTWDRGNACTINHDDGREWYRWDFEREQTFISQDDIRANIRIDLDSPQGFAYGLALWAKHVDACFYTSDGIGVRRAYGISYSSDVRALWQRHIRGETTNDDRLFLAGRLAEMEAG